MRYSFKTNIKHPPLNNNNNDNHHHPRKHGWQEYNEMNIVDLATALMKNNLALCI